MVKAAYDPAAFEKVADDLRKLAKRVENLSARRKKLPPGEHTFDFEKEKNRGLKWFEHWLEEAEVQMDLIEGRAAKKRASSA